MKVINNKKIINKNKKVMHNFWNLKSWQIISKKVAKFKNKIVKIIF